MGRVQKCVRENVEECEAFVLGSVSPTFVLKTHCEGKQASCVPVGRREHPVTEVACFLVAISK